MRDGILFRDEVDGWNTLLPARRWDPRSRWLARWMDGCTFFFALIRYLGARGHVNPRVFVTLEAGIFNGIR